MISFQPLQKIHPPRAKHVFKGPIRNDFATSRLRVNSLLRATSQKHYEWDLLLATISKLQLLLIYTNGSEPIRNIPPLPNGPPQVS